MPGLAPEILARALNSCDDNGGRNSNSGSPAIHGIWVKLFQIWELKTFLLLLCLLVVSNSLSV